MVKFKFLLFCFFSVVLISLGCTKGGDSPENIAPSSNAGASQTITLHVDSVTLSGSGSDPDGHVVAYLWSQISGPALTTIVNPGSQTTKVKGFTQGTYTFQLMVTDDKGATGVSNTTVTVNPAPIITLTFQPSNNANELVLANNNGSAITVTGSNDQDIPIEAWTSSSNPYTVRGILKFDMSQIPSSATILSANLYLYSYPSPTLNGNFTDANFGTNNTLLVEQVTSDWAAATTSWFNLPSITSTNQVVVPSTSQSVLDLNLDVTNITKAMVNNNANYGYFLKLQNETYYNSRIFVASGNTTYSTKHPKLVVVYQ